MTRVERQKTCLSEARNESTVFLLDMSTRSPNFKHSNLECQHQCDCFAKQWSKNANIKNYQGTSGPAGLLFQPCFLEAAVASASSAVDMINMDQYGTLMHIQTLHSQTWRLPVLAQDDLWSQSYNQLSRLETASAASRLSKKATISSPIAVNQASFATDSENHIGHQPATNMRNSVAKFHNTTNCFTSLRHPSFQSYIFNHFHITHQNFTIPLEVCQETFTTLRHRRWIWMDQIFGHDSSFTGHLFALHWRWLP